MFELDFYCWLTFIVRLTTAYHFAEGLTFERKEEAEDKFNVDLFQTKAQHVMVKLNS